MSAPLRVATPEDTTGNALRSPPHSYDGERALLGAILMNNRAHERVSEFLLPQHFADPVNGRLFEICSKTIEQGKLANPVTLKAYAESDDLISAAGGLKYLAALAANAVTVINAADYGKLIYDLFLRREIIAVSEDTLNAAFESEPDTSAQDIIESAEQSLFDLTAAPSNGGFIEFVNATHHAIKIAEMAHRREGALAGVTTGLRDLDEKLAGLHGGDLIILAGRPSMGKTSLATHIAQAAAISFQASTDTVNKGKVVAFFSLEMSADQLAIRLVAQKSKLDTHKIRSGQLSSLEFDQLVLAQQALGDLPLKIDDTASATLSTIRTRCRRLMRTAPIGLIVIDYLQLIASGGRERPENRVQELSAITRGLKALAKDLDVPVIALSQLSRSVEQREDKRPQLSDLRESGTIEQDSDVVMFVYREQYYLERVEPTEPEKWDKWNARMEKVANLCEIIIGKQRHGPIGTVRSYFNPLLTQFSDLAPAVPEQMSMV